jgi:hypothetical protein
LGRIVSRNLSTEAEKSASLVQGNTGTMAHIADVTASSEWW